MPSLCDCCKLELVTLGWNGISKHGTQADSTHAGGSCPWCLFRLSSRHVCICYHVIYLWKSHVQSSFSSICKLSQGAISETSSHLYNETLIFPSLTLCPGLRNPDDPEGENNENITGNQTFAQAEENLRDLSSLVIDFKHVLPNM